MEFTGYIKGINKKLRQEGCFLEDTEEPNRYTISCRSIKGWLQKKINGETLCSRLTTNTFNMEYSGDSTNYGARLKDLGNGECEIKIYKLTDNSW